MGIDDSKLSLRIVWLSNDSRWNPEAFKVL